MPSGSGAVAAASRQDAVLRERLKQYFQGLNEVRRGICLLNAGRFTEAGIAFSRASVYGYRGESLATLLAASYLGQGKTSEATHHLERAARREADQPAAQIRHALSLWADGQHPAAIDALRQAIARDPECAELHFQLGTLLADAEEYDEAELRFTQAANLDRGHTEALVSLALCRGLRQAPAEAVACLQKAQARRPHDPRIGLLLAQAALAVAQQEQGPVSLRVVLPDDGALTDPQGLNGLLRVIETDPDFVDAFLSLPEDQVDPDVFAVLLGTLERALAHQPEHAELHFHCGQVLSRLGRRPEAIDANERAVGLKPRYIRALIELAKLYQATDRTADATTRLEQAVRAGARYADVFFLLGNLYRDQGQWQRARRAYQRALKINARYDAARDALAALPA